MTHNTTTIKIIYVVPFSLRIQHSSKITHTPRKRPNSCLVDATTTVTVRSCALYTAQACETSWSSYPDTRNCHPKSRLCTFRTWLFQSCLLVNHLTLLATIKHVPQDRDVPTLLCQVRAQVTTVISIDRQR